MATFLEALGVHLRVRHFFKKHLTQTCDNVIFKYGDSIEHASKSFHRIPITEATWTVGDHNLASHIFVCGSAMDAIAWLHFNIHRFKCLDSLFFIATGATPNLNLELSNAVPLQKQTPKKIHLIYSNDPTGAICDIKTASFIRKTPVRIRAEKDTFLVTFRAETFVLKQLSLHALEKAAGFHFNIRTHKPKKYTTFYEQLKHGH